MTARDLPEAKIEIVDPGGAYAAGGVMSDHWVENYECVHCGKPVRISVNAAWPEQCPHCRTWHPTLRSPRASDRSLVGAQPEEVSEVGALRQRAPETREGQS